MAHRQAQGVCQKATGSAGKAGEQGEGQCVHGRRQQQKHQKGPPGHRPGGGAGGGGHGQKDEQRVQSQSREKQDHRSADARPQILTEGRPKAAVGTALSPAQALDGGIVKGGGGRPQGHHRQRGQQEEEAEDHQIQKPPRQAEEGIGAAEKSVGHGDPPDQKGWCSRLRPGEYIQYTMEQFVNKPLIL